MTHEELLAKINHTINGFIINTPTKFKNKETRNTLVALRAVVELHKPKIYEGRTSNFFICTGCYEDELYLYPCPTIQAIEKELGASD